MWRIRQHGIARSQARAGVLNLPERHATWWLPDQTSLVGLYPGIGQLAQPSCRLDGEGEGLGLAERGVER